jgi:ketosteroid isomerase-like protein
MSTATGQAKDAIAVANEAFMEIFSHGDAAGIANLYTADGQLLPPHGDMVTGRAGIETFWQGAIDMGIKSAHLSTVELDKCGDTAVETGLYELGDGAGAVLDNGKYLVVWKLDGGTWKLHRDIWNTSVPAS